MRSRQASRFGTGAALSGVVLLAICAVCVPVFLMAVVGPSTSADGACGGSTTATGASGIELGPPGSGTTVGATEYGGPGDPSSGTVGSSGVNLESSPDSYAELGGTTFATATAMGGLPYETPLRVTWGDHSAVAYKRDIGLGGGPIDGYPRVIDLWWQLAGQLGIPYEDGEWSGTVKISRMPSSGAGQVLGATADGSGVAASGTAVEAAASCQVGSDGSGVALTPGPRATLLSDGEATAPANAPAAVRGIIAAGNEIIGKPYVYGGGHGVPLSEISPSYDCSSSVSHLLYGGGLLPATGDMTSGEYESWGQPGPGRWITIYASPDHVFMYVAGLRWDTHNAAGPEDGTAGIGWHPLVREASGFVARHPEGL